MKKTLALMLTLILSLLALLTGCSKSILDPDNPVILTMWHNYGGEMQSTMDYLIDQFNATEGKEKGILIDVTSISSSSELNKSLAMIADGDPGAPDMPDIFTGYPKIAVQFQEKDMLVNYDDYFNKEELSCYVEAFVEEGRLSDGGLYVFPIAKSTEVLYVNQTLFDRFADAVGASIDDLATFEGIAELSQKYYEYSGGKYFYGSDSWFNFAEVGMAQLGGSIFDGKAISLEDEKFDDVFNTIYTPAVKGGILVYDGYSSDLSKTGDLLCSTGSSAGILFYGNTITHADGTVEDVEYSILPYPVFKNGSKFALQRGGGLMVAKSDHQKEYAACEFIKWLTAAEQNMQFIDETGYLPVTRQAFEVDMEHHLETIENTKVKQMLTSVMSMYEEYEFFYAPTYSEFDAESREFEESFFQLIDTEREKYLAGEAVNAEAALKDMKK